MSADRDALSPTGISRSKASEFASWIGWLGWTLLFVAVVLILMAWILPGMSTSNSACFTIVGVLVALLAGAGLVASAMFSKRAFLAAGNSYSKGWDPSFSSSSPPAGDNDNGTPPSDDDANLGDSDGRSGGGGGGFRARKAQTFASYPPSLKNDASHTNDDTPLVGNPVAASPSGGLGDEFRRDEVPAPYLRPPLY